MADKDNFDEIPPPNEILELNEHYNLEPHMPHKDYDDSVMEYIFMQNSFNSWDDVLTWLQTFGTHDIFLKEDELKYLISDVERLVKANAGFEPNPATATAQAKATRKFVEEE